MPTRSASAVISPTSRCVPQDHLNRCCSHLSSLGAARVVFGSEVVAVERRGRRRRPCTRRRPAGCGQYASLPVGADGARSSVRAALGIAMRGPDQLEEAVAVQFRAPLWELLGECRYGVYNVMHPEAGGLFLPAGPGDRWIYGRVSQPGREPVSELGRERLGELIALAAGVPASSRASSAAASSASLRRSPTASATRARPRGRRRAPRRAARRHRDEHRHPRRIRSRLEVACAARLGRRGAARLLRAGAPAGGRAQRRARRTRRSRRGRPMGTAGDLGDRIPHSWVRTPGGRVSTLDLLGPGPTPSLVRRARPGRSAAVACPLPVTLRSSTPSARVRSAYGRGRCSWRPDGAPAACGRAPARFSPPLWRSPLRPAKAPNSRPRSASCREDRAWSTSAGDGSRPPWPRRGRAAA